MGNSVRPAARKFVSCALALSLLSTSVFSNVSLALGAESPQPTAPAAVDATSRPSTEASPTVVRELTDNPTETTREYQLSNGMIRVEYYAHPVKYRDSVTKAMKPVDSTLKAVQLDGRGVSVNKANSFRLVLPDKLSGDWVSVETSAAKVALRPAKRATTAAALPSTADVRARSVSATDRAYPQAFSGTTLEYESRPDGVKETIIVSQPTSATVYSFDLAVTGATPRLGPDGAISILKSGETTPGITIPAPCMWDSAITDWGPEFSSAVHYELSGAAPVWRLDVVADGAWLSDPARVYPVMIDPNVVTSSGAPADTFISSKNQSTNYSSHQLVWVNANNPSANWTEYGLLQLGSGLVGDMNTRSAAGWKVAAGRLKLYMYQVARAGAVSGARCTSAVTISTVKWTTRPNTTTSQGTPAVSTVGAGGLNTLDCGDMLAYWQDTATQNCTLRLGGSAGTQVGYYSANWGTSPVYEIDYVSKPSVSITSPASGGVMQSPQASWSYSDACGNPQVQYQIEVANAPGGAVISSADIGTSASQGIGLPTPAGGWHSSTQYYFRVRAASAGSSRTGAMWSDWTGWRDFTWAAAQPVVALTTPSTTATSFATPLAAWTYSQAQGALQSRYQAEVATSVGGAPVSTADVSSAATQLNLPVPSGGWEELTTYYVRVRAACIAESGGSPVWSNWTSGASFVWNPARPAATITLPSVATSQFATPSVAWTYTNASGEPQASWIAEVATSTSGPAFLNASSLGTATSTVLPTPPGGWDKEQPYFVRVRVCSAPANGSGYVWGDFSPWTPFSYLPVPSAVESVSVETAPSANWFAEGDTNGDGLNDLKDDVADQGRGSVGLSWTEAANATSYDIYLSDGATYRLVGTSGTTIWSSAGKGIFPSDSAIASMSVGTTANPFPQGTGLDLRDDPRALYAKTPGASLDATAGYSFQVVGRNAIGQSATPTAAFAVLDNRTSHVADEPQHSIYEIGDVIGHAGQVALDEGALTLSATDLAIASWGPQAALSRHYSSASTAAVGFAPGWRFNFEQSLSVTGTIATWTDGEGEPHGFRFVSGAWKAPIGLQASLSSTGPGYRITFPGGDRMDFDSAGHLAAESDTNGNTVTYLRTGSTITIIAANGQTIDIGMSGSRVTTATYATAAGTRTVAYEWDGASEATVTTNAGTSDARPIGLSYVAGRLSSLHGPSTMGFTSGFSQNPTYNLEYSTTGALLHGAAFATNPGYPVDVEYGSSEATITLTRDIDGQMISQDAVCRFEFNPNGTLSRRSDTRALGDEWDGSRPEFAYTGYGYDPENRQIREVSPSGSVTRRAYDTRGNLVRETDAAGGVASSVYDNADRVIAETDALGSLTTRHYDAVGNMDVEEKVLNTDGDTARTEFTYDSAGRTTIERSKIDSAGAFAVTTYADFALSGEPQTITSKDVSLSVDTKRDLVRTKGFDEFGDLLWEKDPSGRWVTKSNTYSVSGRLLSSEVVTGTVTRSVYNEMGYLYETSTTAGAGKVLDSRRQGTDVRGALTGSVRLDKTGALSSGSLIGLDPQGSVLRQAPDGQTIAVGGSPHPSLSVTAYDAAGRVVKSWAPGANTSSEASATRILYDTEGRETRQIAPGQDASHATTTTYDALGRAARVDNPDSTWVSREFDAAGNVTAETKPIAGGTAAKQTTLDLAGRVLSTTSEDGATTTFAYDLKGRQVSAGVGDAGKAATVYNSLGNVISQTDADGVTTKTTFDEAGRVTTTEVGSGASASVTQSTYDSAGRLVLRTESGGRETAYGYDEFSHASEETQSVGSVVVKHRSSVFDEFGRASQSSRTAGEVSISTTFAEHSDKPASSTLSYLGATVGLGFDANNGMESARSAAATGFATTLSTTRDAQNRATAQSLSGVGSRGIGYDQAGHVSSQSGWGLTSSGAAYEYVAGRKSAETLALSYPGASGWSAQYAYTPSGRLATASIDGSVTAYSFDAAGNLDGIKRGASATSTLAYDSGNRLTSAGTTTFGWDTAHGWRTSARRSAESSSSMEYTGTGRLSTYNDPNRSLTATYAYDAAGQRTASHVASGTRSTDTTWTYDGIELLGLQSSETSGTTQSSWTITYFRDEGGAPYGGVYTATDASATPFLMVATDRGDVVELTDASGSPFATYRYDAFGNPVTAGTATRATAALPATLTAAIASRQPLRYAGYCWDAESAMYYLSARTYDPGTGQFLTKDPARADGEESAYQYCSGDPVGKVDPSGLFTVPGSKQAKDSNWCWVAASVSVLGFFGHPTSQGVFYDYVKGKNNRYRNLPADDHEVQRGIEHFLGRRISHAEKPLSLPALKSQINHRWPVMVHLKWRTGGPGHLVVVDAYAGNDFRYMDPGTGKHSELIPYSKLVSNRNSTWFSTLYDIGK